VLKFWFVPSWQAASKIAVSTNRRRARKNLSLQIECMEDRAMLSSISVLNTDDSGAGSLRQAILDANANVGADTILFAIGTGQQTIQITTALPAITDPVTIDATSQPGHTDTPLIVLNGSLLPAQSFIDGLVVDTTDTTIKGLVVNGFSEGAGILIGGFGSSGVTNIHLEGNIIGLNAAGTAAVPNSDGVRISDGATLNVIGGAGVAGNVISGNSSYGVVIEDAGSSGNKVLGNAVGTSADRTAAIPNGYGVLVGGGATNNEIGSDVAGEGNLISGNTNDGVFIAGADTANNTVQGNRIGTNAAGTASLGTFTTTAGILIQQGAHNNTIGGLTPGSGNQIAGVSGDGILLQDQTTDANIIQGNLIGVSADGLSAIRNGDDGIFIINASNTQIGGATAAAGNVISGNARSGITIFGPNAIHNTITGNYIGTNITGLAAIPNASDGIRIDGANKNTIGGTAPAFSNLISGNGGNGITLANAGADLNIVQGNLIGTAVGGTTALGNTGDGISIEGGATTNSIGGGNATVWNTIAFNLFKGVEITGDGTVRNTIEVNRIFSNGDSELDLGGDGITANDTLDADTGPNGLQNYPVVSSVNSVGGVVTINGTFNSAASGSYTLDFYASAANDDQGNSQGTTPLGSITVLTDSNGQALFTATLTIAVAPGQVLTATATDSLGNTSEFSASKLIGNTPATSPILTLPSGTLTYQLLHPAVVVDAAAAVTDPDSANFNTGKLTVTLNSNGERSEKVQIRKQGTGSGQITLKGSKVLFEGVVIGKAKPAGGASGKNPLTVTFNASATPAAVTHLLQNITYTDTNKKSTLTSRTLTFQVTDEAGHASNAVNKLVTITH
jgi:hypothetical protein